LTVWKSKRQVMQRYDLTAQMYDERYAEEQEAKYKKALENVNVVNGTVLDVGCGSGLFFNLVAVKAQTVVGVDVSRKLLLQAKEHSKSFGNVYVIQADADYLPFKNGFFDDAFAFTVLQNMPKPNQTLQELKRVANQGGVIVVTALKKAFALNVFMDLLEGAGLWVIGFADDEDLKCYVACCRLLSA